MRDRKEPDMKLYYRDGGGRYRELRRGVPARFAVIALALLAGIVVIASLMQSAPRPKGP
jgi:hypothetical protein